MHANDSRDTDSRGKSETWEHSGDVLVQLALQCDEAVLASPFLTFFTDLKAQLCFATLGNLSVSR